MRGNVAAESASKTHAGTFPCATTSDFFVRLPITELRSWRRRSTLTVLGSSEALPADEAVIIVMVPSLLADVANWWMSESEIAPIAQCIFLSFSNFVRN